jgi:hypothetical protein
MSKGTLESVGIRECNNCMEHRECYDASSVGMEEVTCPNCYADALGHGRVPECFSAAVNACEEALGFCNDDMQSLIRSYYAGACAKGCGHEMNY